MKLKTHALLALVAVLFAFTLSAAEPLPPVPDGMEMYIMALRGSPAGTHVAEPDVEALGGRVVVARLDRRLIVIPPAAAEALRGHARVAFLQRISDGKPGPRSEQPVPRAVTRTAEPSRVTTHSDVPSWDSGLFSYDGSGNITAIGADDYRYDTAGRLIFAEVSGESESYTYDEFGNLKKAGTGEETDVDPETNQLVDRPYDAVGNVEKDSKDRDYKYDAVGMLTRLEAGTLAKRMIYTADDERIAVMTTDGQGDYDTLRVRVRNFQGKVLREWNQTVGPPEWVRDYVYAEGRLVAGERQMMTAESGLRHYHLDHLGSIRRVSRGNGAIEVANVDYLPFGTEMPLRDNDVTRREHDPPDPAKFTGHERDYLGSLNEPNDEYIDYMHARYYDPGMGRFLSVDPGKDWDPTRPQSWNGYTYVRNSPVNNADPTGKFTISVGISFSSGLMGKTSSVKFSLAIDDNLNIALLRSNMAGGAMTNLPQGGGAVVGEWNWRADTVHDLEDTGLTTGMAFRAGHSVSADLGIDEQGVNSIEVGYGIGGGFDMHAGVQSTSILHDSRSLADSAAAGFKAFRNSIRKFIDEAISPKPDPVGEKEGEVRDTDDPEHEDNR
ncbi:MAG TPA: RHS repeat-associated core domain-containing protein [Thermoanaerobaculia bacterium]|nr:RHS repeat-associated core domain-containing protein [Thermoanaerobaculia bacterium]